jgi:NAD(P)-dependent dehydrogenase (short-subunit alcohol dehydrogenase family)
MSFDTFGHGQTRRSRPPRQKSAPGLADPGRPAEQQRDHQSHRNTNTEPITALAVTIEHIAQVGRSMAAGSPSVTNPRPCCARDGCSIVNGIYVNNAGQSTRGPSETLTDEMWQADLDLKVFAQIRFCRLIFPKRRSGVGAASSASSTSAPRRREQTALRPRSAAPPRSRSPRPCRRKGLPTTCWSTRFTSASSSATRSSATTGARGQRLAR